MKNNFTKLFAVLAMFTYSLTTGAQTYTNEDATITWAFTSHESLGATTSPADAFLATNFSVGSNLNMLSVARNGNSNSWGQTYNMVAFVPTETVAKNAGENAANTLTFTITPATGITFTPTNVSLTGCNYAGTGDPKTNIYVLYSDDSKESLYSGNLNRDDKSEVTSPSNLSYDLANAVAGKVIVKIWMDGLTNTSKGVAFTNIVVTGKVSGTPVATTTYTITAATNNASLGSAEGTATVAENEEVELTATPKVSGHFVKWQKDDADFAGNTVNPLTVTATADATYTAIFEANKQITFSGLTDYLASTKNPLAGPYYANASGKFTIPSYAHKYLYRAGYTFTAWSDGENQYASGTELTLTSDITLTPVFTATTKTLANVTAVFDVTWGLQESEILFNSLQYANNQVYYTLTATIGGESVSIPMTIDPTSGKINNSGRASNAQVNDGTKFTLPAVKGMIIVIANASNAFTTSTTIAGEAITEAMLSNDNKTLTYTYNGEASSIDIVVNGPGYLSSIAVTYPITDDGGATALDNANAEEKAVKVIRNGQLIIIRDGVEYNALGNRL